MAQRQKNITELERVLDDATDPTATVEELLREVLKELRQIRGILGHMAKGAAATQADDAAE